MPEPQLEDPALAIADHLDRFAIYKLRLQPLETVKLNPKYHPEGDALFHSLQVFHLARRAAVRRRVPPGRPAPRRRPGDRPPRPRPGRGRGPPRCGHRAHALADRASHGPAPRPRQITVAATQDGKSSHRNISKTSSSSASSTTPAASRENTWIHSTRSSFISKDSRTRAIWARSTPFSQPRRSGFSLTPQCVLIHASLHHVSRTTESSGHVDDLQSPMP